jgi:hypothetical protein
MGSLILSVLLAATVSAQTPESTPVPKDSVQVVTYGCLKGRVLKATSPASSAEVDVVSGPDVTGRSFRLSGPRAVMDDVKKHDKHLVKVVGVVLKSALMEHGATIGRTRVVIGAPSSMDPGGRPPLPGVAVMDISSVQFVAETCQP